MPADSQTTDARIGGPPCPRCGLAAGLFCTRDDCVKRPTQTTLKPCPFCASANTEIRNSDVEPQGDPWYGAKMARYVACNDCGAALFDRYFHEGFDSDEEAATAWNKRAA